MKALVYLILLISLTCTSQTVSTNHIGFSSGLILNFGTHVNSFGFFLKTYFKDNFYQINLGSSITTNIKSYGNRKRFWESRNYLGLILLGGKKDNTFDFQLDGLMHQSFFRNAIGYNYLWYFDNIGTSQRSGGWSLSINKLAFYFENDVFGGQAKDRFRTGSLMVSYRNKDFKYCSGIYLWTGETDGAYWNRNSSNTSKNGFKNLSDLPFGKTSHGIIYSSLIYNLPYGQNVHFKLGVDSEQVRHVVQNRLIHDLVFLPKNIERKTPHYPRLNQDGMPVFEKGKSKKSKLFIQLGANENWSN